MSANLSSIFPEFNLNVVKEEKITGYAFEDYRLDAARLMLYRGEKEIALPPKAVETLLVLVENQGAIVSKDELMSRLWADTVVDESNLTHYLYVLRKTLNETKDGKPFIETFRRRGYRFNGEVRRLETAPVKNNSSAQKAAPISDATRYVVERHGNVLKLADLREAEIPAAENVSPDASAANVSTPSKQLPNGKAAIIAAVAFVLLGSLFYVRYKFSPPAETTANAKGELTILRLTNGGAPQDATISPDGNYFVYHEIDGNVSHLWLQQTGQSNRLEIVPPSKRMIGAKTFSPDGDFVYFLARGNGDAAHSLYRVPTLGGAQSKILDDIHSPVSFSPDGKEMVFQRYNEKTRESALIIASSAGGDERVLLAAGEQETLLLPAWSPGGELIAFSAVNRNTQQSICAINGINPQTGAIETLSPEKWDTCHRMIWTRDGQGLIFVGTKSGDSYTTKRDNVYYLSYPKGEARRLTTDGSRYQLYSLGITDGDEIIAVPFNRSSQIWQMNLDGDSRTAVQITSGLADGRAGLAPLADGRVGYIARMGDNLGVWLMNGDGSNQKQLFNNPPFVEELRASPDGSFFVFSTPSGGRAHLFRVDADSANLRQLTFGNSREIDSTVSPDGNWIVYDSLAFNGDGGNKPSLLKISSAGGEPVTLAETDCSQPHFSPDGKTLSCIYQQKQIVVISAEDGATLKTFQTVNVPTLSFGARWSPDGQALIYIVNQKNHSNLWRQPVEGGEPQPLTDFTSGDIYNFAFSPDGSRLYVARGYQIRDAVLIKNFR